MFNEIHIPGLEVGMPIGWTLKGMSPEVSVHCMPIPNTAGFTGAISPGNSGENPQAVLNGPTCETI